MWPVLIGMTRNLRKGVTIPRFPQRKFLWRSYATIIDGKAIANKLLEELRIAVSAFETKKHHTPYLTALLIGDDSASKLYVGNKVKAAHSVGIRTNVLTFPSTIEESTLLDVIRQLNHNDEVDAILLQLPLPPHIKNDVCDAISEAKDVDGLTSHSFGKFCFGFETFVPCTALAVQKIIRSLGVDLAGKNALICGRSRHVGLPIMMLLHSDSINSGFDCSTVICHRSTPADELLKFCRQADIVISATGIPSLIRNYMVKPNSIVIDVGISRITDPVTSQTKIVGDVNFEEVRQVAGAITPVPGGVGPLTVVMLLQNTLLAAQRRRK